MNSLQHLISHVSTITRKNDEFLDATGGRFNMFRVLGVNHYENLHSAILAEFLNPAGSHGLKHEFLRLFVEGLLSEKEFSDFDFKNAILRTEANTPYGRIDILIEDRNGHAIIIENKIYANDQFEQLKRYDKHSGEQYGNQKYKVFYLTLSGTNASEQSCGDIEYLPISYKFHIIQWLDECVKISSRFPLVRETINQYINSLKQLTNQGIDTLNKNEIVDLIIKSPENLKGAMSIISNEENIKKAIVQKLFVDLEQIATKHKLDFIGDYGVLSQVDGAFIFQNEKWENCDLKFEFDKREYKEMRFGLCYKCENLQNLFTDEKCKELSSKFEFNLPNTGWWPASKYIVKYRNWDNETYLDILEGNYQNYIDELISDVLKCSKEVDI